MISQEVEVINETGIHARPAARIVEVANKFESEIFLIKDGVRANAKSIMNILFLAAEPGAMLELEVEGDDEKKALEAVVHIFKAKFDYEGQ